MLPLLSVASASDLLLDGGRVWDEAGVRDADVLVHDDRVVAVGPDLSPPEGATVLDARGATVLPGLVDTHVHLSLDPGAAWRSDTPKTRDALLRHHLRALLACGVTTVLDPAVLPAEQARIEAALAEGTPGPRYLSLGAPLSPDGGYPAVVVPGFPTIRSPEEVEAALDALVAQGVVGVKTTMEPGFGPPVWPTYSDDVATAIRSGAAARGLSVYTHATTPHEQRAALDALAPRVFVHPPDRPDADLARRVAAAGVSETSTLAILDTWRMAWDATRLDDPLVRLTVPEVELATARDRSVAKRFREAMVGTVYPGLPFRSLAATLGFNEGLVRGRLARTGRALRQLRDAGVPILMGSDSGNWPVIPYEFHGPTSVREVELLVEAGFTPEEALTAATTTPARLLGLAGGVRLGAAADLVVVEGDPLTNIRALRTLRAVVRSGEARTPEGWMRD